MKTNNIISISVDIGKEIIKSGGEISRAEDTVIRINKAFGKSCQVFALPSFIIAQCEGETEMRRIEREDTDLNRLSNLNTLSRKICKDKNINTKISSNSIYSQFILLIFSCIATSSFSIFFGGGIKDAITSFFIAGIITYLDLQHLKIPLFTDNLICAFFSTILAYIPLKLGLFINPDKVIIGTIMLLVPGLTIVSSIRDMMSGDLIAGIFELINAIMSAFGIALGVAGGIAVINWI